MDSVGPFFVSDFMKDGVLTSLQRVPPPPPTFVLRPPPPPPPSRSRRQPFNADKACDRPSADDAEELTTCRCEYVRTSEANLELVASMRMTPLARELWTELLLEANRQKIRKEFDTLFPQRYPDGARRCCYCQGTCLDDFRRPQTRKDISRQPSRSTVDSEPKLTGRTLLTPQSGRPSSTTFPEENDFFTDRDSLERSPESILWMLASPDYNL